MYYIFLYVQNLFFFLRFSFFILFIHLVDLIRIQPTTGEHESNFKKVVIFRVGAIPKNPPIKHIFIWNIKCRNYYLFLYKTHTNSKGYFILKYGFKCWYKISGIQIRIIIKLGKAKSINTNLLSFEIYFRVFKCLLFKCWL